MSEDQEGRTLEEVGSHVRSENRDEQAERYKASIDQINKLIRGIENKLSFFDKQSQSYDYLGDESLPDDLQIDLQRLSIDGSTESQRQTTNDFIDQRDEDTGFSQGYRKAIESLGIKLLEKNKPLMSVDDRANKSIEALNDFLNNLGLEKMLDPSLILVPTLIETSPVKSRDVVDKYISETTAELEKLVNYLNAVAVLELVKIKAYPNETKFAPDFRGVDKNVRELKKNLTYIKSCFEETMRKLG